MKKKDLYYTNELKLNPIFDLYPITREYDLDSAKKV
jgi:hypothetical protein